MFYRLTISHQSLLRDFHVRMHQLDRALMTCHHRLPLRLRLLALATSHRALSDEFREPVTLDQHAYELLETVDPLRLRDTNHVVARHRLRSVRPVRR